MSTIEKAWDESPRCECSYPMTLVEYYDVDGVCDDDPDREVTDLIDVCLECISCRRRSYTDSAMAQAQRVEAAYGKRMKPLREAFQGKLARDREQARQLFERAGKPLPAWLQRLDAKLGEVLP